MNKIFAYKGRNIAEHKLFETANKMKEPEKTFSSTFKSIDDVFLAAHRIPIIDLTHRADQPFVDYVNNRFLICDGRIYNSRFLKQKLAKYDYLTTNDCEVILPLLSKTNAITAAQALDGDFSFVSYDTLNKDFVIARDLFGTRPLFYGENSDGDYAVASEEKALHDLFQFIKPFPPGNIRVNGNFTVFRSLEKNIKKINNIDEVQRNLIEKATTEAVVKRLQSDQDVVFTLNNDIYSQVVCMVASKALGCSINTLSVEFKEEDSLEEYKFAEKIGAVHINLPDVIKKTGGDPFDRQQQEKWLLNNFNTKTIISCDFPYHLFLPGFSEDSPGVLAYDMGRNKFSCFSEVRNPYYDLQLTDLFLEVDNLNEIKKVLTGMRDRL